MTQSLQEAVRKLAFKTSVDQLQKRGVKDVKVLGLDRIVALIEEATNRSLKHRLLAGDRAAIANATKEEFLRLLKTNQDLKQSRDELKVEKERAVSDAGILRKEMDALANRLKDRLVEAGEAAREQFEDEDDEVRELVELLYQDALQSGDQGKFKDRMSKLLFGLLEEKRRAAIAATEAAKGQEVSQLQRRIAKLNETLEQTESKLSMVSSQGFYDSGVASVYREVQGLSLDAKFFELKKELMEDIFKANLHLQKGQQD
jgi:hypothetical protein